jgi:acetolactate synthase-1/2/3 large subunit
MMNYINLKINCIMFWCHEQGATHAAQGFARATGKVGYSSFRTRTNLVTGIADAQIDSTPMVCITGQVGKHLLGF